MLQTLTIEPISEPTTENPNGWEFVSALVLIRELQLTRALLAKMREVLPAGIYWRRPSERKFFYNFRLVADYLLRGDSEEHRQLVQAYQDHMKQLIST